MCFIWQAKEGTVHSKKIALDKSKDSGSNDISFDAMEFDWSFKASGKSGNALAGEVSGGLSSGSGPAPQPVAPQPVALPPSATPLPLEDAKEMDKLNCKVDEAMRAMAKMSVDAERMMVALPQNALGTRQKDTIEELLKICKDKEVTLRHIAVHGRLPGHTAKINVGALRAIVEEFHSDYSGLKQACQMAQPLLKPPSGSK